MLSAETGSGMCHRQCLGPKREGGSLVLIFCFFRLTSKFCPAQRHWTVVAISAAPHPAATMAGDPGSRVSTAQGDCLCAHRWQRLGLPWRLLAGIRPGKHLAFSDTAFRDRGGGGTLLLGSGAPKEGSKDPGYETFSSSRALE